MVSISPDDARDDERDGFAVCDQILELLGDRAEGYVSWRRGTSALTRFANSRIHQNMAGDEHQVRLRAALPDGRVAQATTTRLDDEGLARLVEGVTAAARLRPAMDPPGEAS